MGVSMAVLSEAEGIADEMPSATISNETKVVSNTTNKTVLPVERLIRNLPAERQKNSTAEAGANKPTQDNVGDLVSRVRANVPGELKQLPQWVTWKSVPGSEG